MLDRRQGARDNVIYGGRAEIDEHDAARACIARKGHSFLAKVVWWRDNFAGLAFSAETPSQPVSDLEERLRKSEIKKRQLQRRIKKLLDER